MARLHADEDFVYPVVEQLRVLGHDVLTVQEASQGNQKTPDQSVLAFAVGLGRAILTFNRLHFIRLHQKVQPHAGIVVCTRDADVAGLAGRIDRALVNCPVLDNQLVRINRPP
jgi:hypothetical protein